MPETTETTRPDTQAHELLDRLLRNGEHEKAETHLREMMKVSADDPALVNALGTIYAARGDFLNAEKTFNQALILDPNFADAYYNFGIIHARQSRQSEAVEDFLNAVRINPADSAAHNDLGVIYYSQGKSLLAKGHFIKALEANPLYKSALMNLFEICWDNGAYSEALSWVEKFLRMAEGKAPLAAVPEPARETVPPPNPRTLLIGDSTILSPTKEKLIAKRRSPSQADDIFMKHIPGELRDKKKGMNIAVVADFNIAGQLSLLFRMINMYTIHKARLVILQGDYLSYDNDIILSNGKRQDYDEARQIIENADFYHIGRSPINFGNVNWSAILAPDNCVVQYYGSEIRHNAEGIYRWHTDNKFIGVSCWDYTMIQNAPLFYHINIMCDLSRVRLCDKPGDVIRICHPPTNRAFKKTELFLSAMERLKRKYPVEVELIEGKSNEECLEIKSRCQITYDQISVGIYGLSAIESMAAGHAVLCGISNFASSFHPDNPIVYVHENNLYDKIEHLLNNKDEISRIGSAGRLWARRHHDPLKIIRQFTWIYDLAVNGHRFAEERDAFMIR